MTRAFMTWVGLLLCLALVAICMAWIDRPLALFFSAHTAQSNFANFLDPLITPRKLMLAAVVLVALGSGVQALRGRELTEWPRVLLACVASAAVAVAVEIALKHVFGRGDPYPTYLRDHAYGFHFLHGGLGWATFPSGTATVSFALAATLAGYPRLCIAAYVVATLLSVLVVVLNYHWLSDIIAGAFLGITIGLLITRLSVLKPRGT